MVHDAYKSAVLPSGLVTFIAAFHYLRVFDSREEDYSCSAGGIRDGVLDVPAPALTGVPFNGDHHCTDWLITVPLLLNKTLLVTPLDEATFNAKAKSLGAGSALLVISGYHAELTVTDDLMPRRIYRVIFMTFLLHVVRGLPVSSSRRCATRCPSPWQA